MKILSVNRGTAAPLRGTRPGAPGSLSGIDKRPLDGPATITRNGVPDDAIVDQRYHGGPDQAVYIYAGADYEWWEGRYGRPFPPGTFGENLTFDVLDHGALAIGDRFRIGSLLLEVTAPRIPCGTLAKHLGDTKFLKAFREAARPGPYCRVLAEGAVSAGDSVLFEPGSGDRVSLLEVFEAEFVAPDAAMLRRHLAAPLAERFRQGKEERLATLEAS